MMMRSVFLILVCGFFCSALCGCSMFGKRVNAYERNILAKPGMSLEEGAKDQASQNHMYDAREGSVGGFGGAGGGCGCN